MLAGMARNEKKNADRPAARDWTVYLVRCADKSLYTGTTNNLKRRIKMHNSGTGARYTRTRRPVMLLYKETGLTRSEALVRECAVKAMPKAQKEILVKPRRSRRKTTRRHKGGPKK